MATSQWRVPLILCGAFCALNFAVADPPRVAGVVVNNEGKPVPNAEVRADKTDSTARYVTKTNADGKYVFASLPAGKYSITVVSQNGAHTEARVATVGSTSDSGQPIRRFISALPYQVKPDYRAGSSANVRARYVWQPGETGSHIGGRWIKASDAAPSTNQLEVLGGSDMSHAPFLRINSSAK